MQTAYEGGREERLKKLKKIVCSFFGEKEAEIYLMGSWARGEERRTSDIDIGFILKDKEKRRNIAFLSEILEESDIPYRVELVDLTCMDEKKREAFLKGAVKWRG